MNLHYKTTPINSVDEVYELFASSQFESPFRSTIPLLSWLKHEPEAITTLFCELGIAGDYKGHLEYTVTAPQGKNSNSQTDLMVIGNDAVVAIECKWTEGFDETVEKWSNKGNQDNRSVVLDGWLQLLQGVATQELMKSSFGQVINQMIHRSASACHARKRPILAYLLFHPSPEKNTPSSRLVREELAHLWRLLGRPNDFTFLIIEIEMTYTPVFEELAVLPKESQDTATRVKAALSSSKKIFRFGVPTIQRIGADE